MENIKVPMTSLLVTIGPLDSLERAESLMRARKFRHLPVVDGGKVVGILSDRDLQRAKRVELSDHGAFVVQENSFNPDFAVKDFMSWPIETIDRAASVKDAAERLIQKKISALLVTDGKDVCGILTSEDLLKALVCGADVMALRQSADEGDSPATRLQLDRPLWQIVQALSSSGV